MNYRERYFELVNSGKIRRLVPKDSVPMEYYGGRYRGVIVKVERRRIGGFNFVDHLGKFKGHSNIYISDDSVNYERTIKVNTTANRVGW